MNQFRQIFLAITGLCFLLVSGALAQAPPPARVPQASNLPSALPPPPPPGPIGVWIDHTGRGAVEITQCGANLCGNIVWLKDPNDKLGKPLRDELNEDRTKRTRPICGLPILGNLKLQRDGSWDLGWIYDPEQGESFDVELRMRGPDQMQVKGYKGMKFLSETFQWTRASNAPFQRCVAS